MLSVPHLIIIFLVALIVFGPEKLPELARGFGKAMAEFKRATGDLKSGFEEHMRELERETQLNEARKHKTEQSNTILPSATVDTVTPEPVSEDKPSAPEAEFPETVSEKPKNGS